MRRRIRVTVQQVCALATLTVRKHKLEGKNPIGAADLEWIFACNYEGTESLRIKIFVRFYSYKKHATICPSPVSTSFGISSLQRSVQCGQRPASGQPT